MLACNKNVSYTIFIYDAIFTFLTYFIFAFFILKTSEKWHTHIIKQHFKMTFSFVMQ